MVCVCVDGPAFRCHGAAVKLLHPPDKKIGKIRRERVLLATSLRQKFFAKLPQKSRQKELSRGLIPGRWLFPYPMTRGQKNDTMVKWN